MQKTSRKMGIALSTLIKEKGISLKEAALSVEYSFRDFRRLIEGRLIVSPTEWERISAVLGTSFDYLVSYEPSDKCLLPDLEYNKEFSDVENLYMIVDYLDEYIELIEQL